MYVHHNLDLDEYITWHTTAHVNYVDHGIIIGVVGSGAATWHQL